MNKKKPISKITNDIFFLQFGGRKNTPSIEEITAITAGRNSKRQIYRLPGGTERVINTKSTTVVDDIVEELCKVGRRCGKRRHVLTMQLSR